MRLPFSRPEPLPVLALYQRFWHDEASRLDRYHTAALMRHDNQWVVLCVTNEFRGEWEVTLHGHLEDARAAMVKWVGKAREVEEGRVPGSVWNKIDSYRRTGDIGDR